MPDINGQEQFTDTVLIPYEARYTPAEFQIISKGFRAQVMEDKWDIIYEAPYLSLYRSWTGLGVYRAKIQADADCFVVVEAEANREVAEKDTLAYSAALLDFLISNLLLRRHKPFPKPAAMANDHSGLFQHHISGTGYGEKVFEAPREKPWWRFW
jgi:hypothetical protein